MKLTFVFWMIWPYSEMGLPFFDDLSFGSKLIGMASYNVSGQDISIVSTKNLRD